jgi:hypothetical protein
MLDCRREHSVDKIDLACAVKGRLHVFVLAVKLAAATAPPK